jgi:hypothetical protein
MPAATRSTRSPRANRAGPGRYARGAMHRSQGLRRRRQSQPTGVKGMLARMPGRSAATRATPGSKKGKAGGLALVAAAAGMAFKYRDKLGRKGAPDRSPTTPPAA